ncbi:bromodomain-containing protein 4 [Hylaeus anthracinus]|uniref:bromodomain-containing protein 4 n=1 Tax=Hylaeus anthracinus TaxID=313031 RepID=UPI0023B89AD8|nr:bromodomain-containing protein 4 [Hylaeus anthracinus]
MEKEQPDSLATVAVVSEKMAQPHSNYAPSEVYSSAEPPPAYMRPKSTAVQIARIAAITLVTMSFVFGSFFLAASWVQARATCTPESIAAMQAELRFQQQQPSVNYQQGEFLKHLQPEALIQESTAAKEIQQSLAENTPSKKDPEPDTKDIKIQKDDENNSKTDNENGDHDEDDDDYDDDEFPPVHIKLPLQFDFDEIAGTLIQEARSRVSCVVERRRADQVMDGANNNNVENATDSRYQRLSGERVAILCESGNPHQEQQENEMLTPIIIPLGTVQVPLQNQEQNTGYHQYQVHTQYQVPDMQQLPLSDPRGLNHIPPGVLPPELRNLPQMNVEMRPPRMGPQAPVMGPQGPMMGPQNPAMGPQIEMRRIPIEVRQFPMNFVRGMRPPMPQDPQQVPMMYQQVEQTNGGYGQEQGPMMMPPPVPQPEGQAPEQRVIPHVMITQTEQRPPQPQMPPQMPPQMQPQPQPQPQQPQPQVPERPRSPFQGIPFEIRRIIQQVPLEIKNIIQHITGEARPVPVQVPDGARRENVQEFKPFPEGAQPIPLGLPLPVEVRNLLEHGNIEGRQRPDGSNEQQEAKPFPGPDDDSEEERNFPVPAEIRNIIHQVVEGNAFPMPRFALPLRPVESLDIPVEARAEVTDGQNADQESEQRQQDQQQTHMMMQQQQPQHLQPHQQQQPQEQEEESRPHYMQPRSVRSIPDAFVHRREKRVRRCACDCAC